MRDPTGVPLQSSSAPLAPALPRWRWLGERALRLASGEATLACYAALRRGDFVEIEDLVPADGTLLLVLKPGTLPSPGLLAALAAAHGGAAAAAPRRHEISVEYGGAAGPDLPALARRAGLDVEACVQAHAAAEYTVAFLGFQPGFPYLTGLPASLEAPRRATPRTRVPAGSVAIGGRYTGVYPGEGPGGWHLIGRTRALLFDPERDPPALFAPGDRVRFVPA